MNDSRAEKLKADLDQIEAELCRLIKEHLPGALDGDCLFFFNSDHPPPPTFGRWPDRYIREYSEAILQLAKQSLALRRELILSTEDTPAALYLAACTESTSVNEHRRGTRRLAEWLLDELARTSQISNNSSQPHDPTRY
jgi:hypothetical protein